MSSRMIARAREGGQHAVLRDRGESLHVGVAGIEEDVAGFVVFDPHAEVVEEVGEEGAEERIGVGGADAVDDARCDGGVEGVEFEQAVAALFHFQRELAAKLGGLGDESLEFGCGRDARAPGEGEEAGFEFVLVVVAAVERGLEGIETAVIPLDDTLLGAAGDVGHVDADRLSLADTVEATDALLEETGVEREIEEDEVVGELKVAALAADLGADEELRAVGFGEPRGLAVALHEREPLVEETDLEADFFLQGGLESDDLALGFADEVDFGRALREEKSDEPVEARVFAEGVAERAVLAGFLGGELARDPGELREVLAGVERDGAKFARRETRHRGAGVAEHDAAGAVLVEEALEERFAGAGFRGGQGVEVLSEARGVAVEDFFQRGAVFGRERLLLDDFFGDAGDGAEALGLGDELPVVVIACGIEEAQAREMAGEA